MTGPGIESRVICGKTRWSRSGKTSPGRKLELEGVGIVRLMEQERGVCRRRTLFRSFIRGVQILNRILDECISLTRLRPVTKDRRGEGGDGGVDEEKRERVCLNAIINLCLALWQWAGRRERKEGFKPRPTYATGILSNGSCPKTRLIRQENGFCEPFGPVNITAFDFRAREIVPFIENVGRFRPC